MKKIIIGIIIFCLIVGGFLLSRSPLFQKKVQPVVEKTAQLPYTGPLANLQIDYMRKQSYPGSQLKIEEELSPGTNYRQYIASYVSEGNTIYGLLTVPTGTKPTGGWPVIIFNHGYIPPKEYRTTERYVAYVAGFARNGYIVFKSDYRGHGNSQGNPSGQYYAPDYTIDVLNAIATLKKFPDANPNKIGMWGHSMGGNITLRSLVVDTKDIKVAVIWAGVVGNYDDIINHWRHTGPLPADINTRVSRLKQLIAQIGGPDTNPIFWNSIDPYAYLKDITAPIQLHVGLADEEVPFKFSEHLKTALENNKKHVELYEYEGTDHNLSGNAFAPAMQRSIEFFDKYLK